MKVLERPTVPGEPERRALELAGTLYLDMLLRACHQRLHLGEGCRHMFVAGVVVVGEVPVAQAQPLDNWHRTAGRLACRSGRLAELPVRLALLGGLQSAHGLDQLDHGQD